MGARQSRADPARLAAQIHCPTLSRAGAETAPPSPRRPNTKRDADRQMQDPKARRRRREPTRRRPRLSTTAALPPPTRRALDDAPPTSTPSSRRARASPSGRVGQAAPVACLTPCPRTHGRAAMAELALGALTASCSSSPVQSCNIVLRSRCQEWRDVLIIIKPHYNGMLYLHSNLGRARGSARRPFPRRTARESPREAPSDGRTTPGGAS